MAGGEIGVKDGGRRIRMPRITVFGEVRGGKTLTRSWTMGIGLGTPPRPPFSNSDSDMTADDIQDLYKLLRGSRSAMLVLDAKALFLDRQWSSCLALLKEARESFAESRSRLLKQDPEKEAKGKGKDAERSVRRLKRKQEKVREILDGFDEMFPQLEKLAKREQQRQARDGSEVEETIASDESAKEESWNPDSESSDSDFESSDSDQVEWDSSEHEAAEISESAELARPSDLDSDFADAYRASVGDEQLLVIGRQFGFREVMSENDIHSNALYFIRSGTKSFLIRTLEGASSGDQISLASAIDDTPMKPFAPKAFLKLGKKRKMVLLTSRR